MKTNGILALTHKTSQQSNTIWSTNVKYSLNHYITASKDFTSLISMPLEHTRLKSVQVLNKRFVHYHILHAVMYDSQNTISFQSPQSDVNQKSY